MKTFSHLYANRWGCVHTLLVVWSEVSQRWNLQAFGWSQALRRKWAASQWVLPRTAASSFFVHALSHSLSTFTVDPPIAVGRYGPGCYVITTFFLGPGRHTAWVEFLFPPVLWKFCNQTLPAFKARFSGASLPTVKLLGWRAWRGAQNFHSYGRTSMI